MQCIFDERHTLHRPVHFLSRGVQRETPEKPERAEQLKAALGAAGFSLAAADDLGMTPIRAVHSARYLNFLQHAHDEWQQLGDASEEVIPNVFAVGEHARYPESIVGRAGFHLADMAAPISRGTWQAAFGAAQTALTATALVVQGAPATYALCRPPGHHASADRAAGYCFLNNVAIAAEYLLQHGSGSVAILDIDVHHGNGTQEIFYPRDDVLVVSLHGDPAGFYPFYWGYAEQTGTGNGVGYTLNHPLPMGTGDRDYLTKLDSALRDIRHFQADALVVSLGLDTSINDPYAAFRITRDGFSKIGAMISALQLPTVLVQEGGYLADDLGQNLIALLSSFAQKT